MIWSHCKLKRLYKNWKTKEEKNIKNDKKFKWNQKTNKFFLQIDWNLFSKIQQDLFLEQKKRKIQNAKRSKMLNDNQTFFLLSFSGSLNSLSTKTYNRST